MEILRNFLRFRREWMKRSLGVKSSWILDRLGLLVFFPGAQAQER